MNERLLPHSTPGFKLVERPDGYFLRRPRSEKQLTNFTMKLIHEEPGVSLTVDLYQHGDLVARRTLDWGDHWSPSRFWRATCRFRDFVYLGRRLELTLIFRALWNDLHAEDPPHTDHAPTPDHPAETSP